MKTKIFLSLMLFNSILYAADLQYSITPLPSAPLDIESARVNDINDSGQIVGSYKVEGQPLHAFISSEVNGSRVMTDLGQGTSSEAFSINNLGQVVGAFTIDDPRPESGQGAFFSHSFIANKTNNGWVMTDLTPEAFRSSAHDINESGEVVGNIGVEGEGKPSVFVGIVNESGWNVTNIGIQNNFLSYIQIDNTSRVLASARTRSKSVPIPFMAFKQGTDWDIKKIKYLQESVQVRNHNNVNQVVGYFGVPRLPETNKAFVATFNNGNWDFTELGTFEGNPTRAYHISDVGQIVGTVEIFLGPHPRNYKSEAILFSEGQIYDLKALVSTGIDGWSELSNVAGINNSGQIIGAGIYNQKHTPFILTPINQEPVEPPVCELGVDPQQIKKGEGVALWWWSDAVVSGSIDNGIGSVSDASGYHWIYPTETTSYTLTANGENGTTTTCATTIIVEGQIELNPPYCEVGADPEVIKLGEGSALWWWTENVSSANIDNGIGAVTTPSNYTWFYPTATSTYTMNAVSDSGATTSCKVTIEVVKD